MTCHPPRSALLCLAVVLVAAVATFGGSIGNGFVWDDLMFIARNSVVHDLRNVPLFFVSGDALGTGVENPYYRPLTTSTFALDYALWGESPAGFHATNVALHAAVSALVFLVIRLFAAQPAACAAALLFAVHPAHAEPVGYVSARADLLCALFLLLAFFLYARQAETGGRRHLAFSLLSFLLALLAKIVAVVLPALLALHLVLFVRRERRWASVLPYLAVTLVFLGVRSYVLPMEVWKSEPLVARLATAGPILLTYLRQAILPVDLKVFYDVPLRPSLLDPRVLGAWAALAAIAGSLVACGRRQPTLSFGLAWFFAALLPACGLVTLLYPAYMADRYLYIPLIGVAIALGPLLERSARSEFSPRRPVVIKGVVATIIIAFSATAATRLPIWHDSLTLWRTAAEDAPLNTYTLTGLGWAYKNRGLLTEAEGVLERAVALRDDTALPHVNLAGIAFMRGDLAAAERHTNRALELEPADQEALTYLGILLAEKGYSEQAEAVLSLTLRANPFNRRARDVLVSLRQPDPSDLERQDKAL